MTFIIFPLDSMSSFHFRYFSYEMKSCQDDVLILYLNLRLYTAMLLPVFQLKQKTTRQGDRTTK